MSKRNLKTRLVEILGNKHLCSVAEFLSELKKQKASYNKTSVYRALEQLLAEGTICKQHFGETEAQYELRDHHHAHAVCRKCQKVKTVDCKYDEPESVKDFSIDHHHVTLIGVCGECG